MNAMNDCLSILRACKWEAIYSRGGLAVIERKNYYNGEDI